MINKIKIMMGRIMCGLGSHQWECYYDKVDNINHYVEYYYLECSRCRKIGKRCII